MSRATRFAGLVAVFLALWVAALRNWFVPYVDVEQLHPLAQTLLPWLPLHALLAFGFYSLGVVIYKVFSFKDKSAEMDLLQQDIADAKRDLKTKGMSL